MSSDIGRRPASLWPMVLLALSSLLLSFANYGAPFPFMGTFHQGAVAERFVFGDSLISLYLLIGVLKRQRITVWLLIAYNLLDVCNAWVNLFFIPAAEYARLAEAPVPPADLLSNTMIASIALMLMNIYIFRIRREFDNRSPYLF